MKLRERIARYYLGLAAPERKRPEPARIAAIVPAAQGTTQAKQAAATVKNTGLPWQVPPLIAGRQSQAVNVNLFGLSAYNFIWRREYQDVDLTTLNPSDYEAGQLLTILADLSPDVSKAVWNIIRMCGVDLTFQCVDDRGNDDAAGQKLVDKLVKRINAQAGGIDNVIVQLVQSAYVQGGVCMEVAPMVGLHDVDDFYPVNPSTIYFMRDEEQKLVPFQRQYIWGSGVSPFRRMNTETFFYTPIDPAVDDPYGRPPLAAILQVIFFQVEVLTDLRRVIHAQGWPKIDISMVSEILLQHMPPEVRLDTARQTKWVQERLNEIVAAYNAMAPEDAFIHLDYVQVNSDAVASGSKLFDYTALLAAIRGQIISAVKQLPVVMGEHTGSTETYSTIELTIFAHTIDAFRLPVGRMLARALEVSLQLMGHSAVVNPQWAPAQIYDRMSMAMAEGQEMSNESYKRDEGWQDNDAAAKSVTGSQSVARPRSWDLQDQQIAEAKAKAFAGPTSPAKTPANPPSTPNPGKPGSMQPKK